MNDMKCSLLKRFNY